MSYLLVCDRVCVSTARDAGQECPDERMTMTRSVTGQMLCSCAAGYLQVGDSRVGAESCVLASQGQAFFNNERREWHRWLLTVD
mgnify:CR=1 FL=1